MFDLRAISSTAPVGDLVFGVIVILVAAAIANLAIIPKLMSRDALSARILIFIAILGWIAGAATLAVQPPKFYLVALTYVVAFLLIGLAVSWRNIGRSQAIVRVVGGSAFMFVALAAAYWVANAPR